MKLIIISASLIVVAGFAIYFYRQAASKREREKTIAELEALPPVKMDFSTPEGAILCLEDAYPRNDLESAVACHDFETLARLWLREKNIMSEQMQKEMLPEMIKTMENSYRESNANGWIPGWDKAKSYFPKRETYSPGLVAVSKVTVGPDRGLFSQCILVAVTPNGWKVVAPLVKTSDGWRVTEPASKSEL